MPSADLSAMFAGEAIGGDHVDRAGGDVVGLDESVKLDGQPEFRSVEAAVRMISLPFSSSVPMLRRPTVGSRTPRTLRAKTSPITANCGERRRVAVDVGAEVEHHALAPHRGHDRPIAGGRYPAGS